MQGGKPGFAVETAAVRAEATKWDELADDLVPIHRAVQDANLEITAFFIGDPVTLMLPQADAMLHHASYNNYLAFMDTVVSGAKEEFPQIAEAMIKTATLYENGEDASKHRFDEIYGKAE